MSQEQAIERAIRLAAKWGWTVTKSLLYDEEEGVEGWEWKSPEGRRFYEIGDWQKIPEPPNEFLDYLSEHEYTEGSWRVDEDGEIISGCWVLGRVYKSDDEECECQDMGSGEGKANARRIVACVNALAGVPTDFLEKLPEGALADLVEHAFGLGR